MTIVFEAAWRLFLVAVCWWMLKPHWPVSGVQEVVEGLIFIGLAVLALLGQIGDRD